MYLIDEPCIEDIQFIHRLKIENVSIVEKEKDDASRKKLLAQRLSLSTGDNQKRLPFDYTVSIKMCYTAERYPRSIIFQVIYHLFSG